MSTLAALSLRTLRPTKFQITIISAQNIPRAKGVVVDPYVRLQTFGLPCDTAALCTDPIENNAFKPYWNEVFEFEVVAPELMVVRFGVYVKHNVA